MVRAQIFPFTRSKSTFPWVSICAQRCLVLKNLRHSFWPRTMFLATHKLIFTARKHESCSLLVENLLSQFLMYFCRWLIVNKLLCYVINWQIINKELEKFSLNFSRCGNRHVAPLTSFNFNLHHEYVLIIKSL